MACKYNANGILPSDVAYPSAVSTKNLAVCTSNSKVVNTQDLFVQPFGSEYPPFSLPDATLAKYNILAYGGDNTNTVDNTALVNKLLQDNFMVYFPRGQYRFDGSIEMTANTKIIGDYNGITAFNFYNNTLGHTMITMDNRDLYVKDIQVRYYGTATNDAVVFGGESVQRVRITGVQSDVDVASFPPIFASFSGDSKVFIDNSVINVKGTNGILASGTSNIVITNNKFIRSTVNLLTAIETTDTATVVVTNNIMNDFDTVPPNMFTLASGGSYIANNLIGNVPLVFSGAGVAGSMIFNNGDIATQSEYSNVTHGLRVDGTKVIGARVTDAALSNVPNSGDAGTDALITALKDIIIAHGLGQA